MMSEADSVLVVVKGSLEEEISSNKTLLQKKEQQVLHLQEKEQQLQQEVSFWHVPGQFHKVVKMYPSTKGACPAVWTTGLLQP